MTQYGYTGYYKPPPVRKMSSLAQAASGKPAAADPFGLLTDTTDSARVARMNATPHIQAHTVIPSSSAAPSSPQAPQAPPATPVNTAPKVANAYDIHTDPALQEVDALTGKTEEDARAAALQQKQAQLLQYGDPALARSLLGDETIAQAAAANPNSTVQQLGTQRDHNLHQLTEDLNKGNLLFGGYRINQEDQAGRDYQNALAQAAAGVNSNIGQIDANLASALGGTQAQHIQALIDAYNRHAADPGVDPGAAGGTDPTAPPPPPPSDQGPGPTDPNSGFGVGGASFLDANDPNVDRLALALAASKRGVGNIGY
jgi:hypothetical protein